MKILTIALNEAPALSQSNGPASRVVTAINAALQPKTEWTVVKYGVYPNPVGLQVLDRTAAERMVAAFNSKASRLATLFRGEPIYVGHPDDEGWARQNPGVRAEAVGRIRELRVGDEGLELKLAYNDQGERLVGGEAPAYTSFSPVWGMERTDYRGRKAFRPVELYSIGITNTPLIPGTFIGLNEALPPEPSTPMKEKLIQLLAALGITVAADADETALSTAINEATPKVQAGVQAQAQLVTVQGELDTTKASLTTATNEAATLRTSLATERSERAGLLITTAINEGRLTEAQRPEWLGKFTAQGADFAAVAGELGKLTKAVNTQSRTDGLGKRRNQPVSPEQKQRLADIEAAISAKMKVLNTEDRILAYNALVREKHTLFQNAVSGS
jgi:phage I-like protein